MDRGYVDRNHDLVTTLTGGTVHTLSDEDMTSMPTAKHGECHEDEGDQQGFPSREEGQKLILFESPRWRPKTTQVRVHLRV